MTEYIKREDAIEAFYTATGDGDKADWAVGVIKSIPSADVVERKTGKWIDVDDYSNIISGSCSACGWQAHLYEDDVVGMNFCPNCGAKMEN